jgi:outer membrane murein-binding lipoprotein Lpp
MKKGLILTVVAAAALLVTGCSNTASKSTRQNETKTTRTTSESSFYDSLSAKDKKNLKFKFREAQDETADNKADPVYVVSMKVTNKTDKTVKFDQSKFLIFVNEETKFTSAKTGTLTLKPGQSKTVNQLFENVAEQALVGGGSQFLYLNKDNKLANANFATPNSKDVDESTPSQTTNSKTQTTDTTQDTSDNNELDIDEARQILVSALPGLANDVDNLNPVRLTNGWAFQDPDAPEQWSVFDNGMVQAPGDHEPVYPY